MNRQNFINEDEMITLINDLDRHSDNISGLFDRIDRTISGLPDCYKSSACEAIMSSYQSFRQNYKIIKNNLTSYSDDYICLVQKMQEGETALSKMFEKYTESTIQQAKNVRYNQKED